MQVASYKFIFSPTYNLQILIYMTTKTVLITGAAKRIGKAIALSLAADGWDVAIHYNNSAKEAEETAGQIRQLGRKAIIIQADLTDDAQVKTIFAKARKELGHISCLINNASIFKNDNISNLQTATMAENMATHLYAPLILAQEFSEQLKGDGNIINMLDYCVLNLPDKFLSYAISKSALWTATQMIARQLAPAIRVNGIGPGNCLMNYMENQEHFEKACKATPLEKPTSVDEVCNAVKFILSSPTMTGQIIALDSGKHLLGADYYN